MVLFSTQLPAKGIANGLLRGRSDPGICQRQGMAGLDAGGLHQQWFGRLHPVQGQGFELLIGQPTSALIFVFPNAVEHLHAGEKAGITALRLLQCLFDLLSPRFVVAQGEQR